MFKDEDENDILSRIVSVMDNITGKIHELIKECELSPTYKSGDFFYPQISYKIFSDNVIVSLKLTDDDEKNIRFILTFILYAWLLQRDLIERYGMFIRGSLTRGKLFIDDDILFGSGLIRAYTIENEVAKYPRIIIDKSIMTFINSFDESSMNVGKYLIYELRYKGLHKGIITDADGNSFIFYMQEPKVLGVIISQQKFLSAHRNIVIERLKKYSIGTVREKYLWCREYHNVLCSLDDQIDMIID